MPLTLCPDCGGSVSDAAPACIHCGRPVTQPTDGRIQIPPAAPMQRARCPNCRAVLDSPAVFDGGLLDCAECGVEIRVLTPNEHEAQRSVREPSTGDRAIASIASLFIPGLGQIAQKRFAAGAGFFLAAVVAWAFTLGWVLHLWAAVDAVVWKAR